MTQLSGRAGIRTIDAVTITAGSPSTEVVEGEVKPYSYDASHDLQPDQVMSDPVVELRERTSGEEVDGGASLEDPPTVVDRVLYFRVAEVERGKKYELRIEFDHDPPRVEGEHTIRLHEILGC